MRKSMKVMMALCAVMLAVGVASVSAQQVVIRYSMWDSNQLPAYQKVAENFMAKNPNIKIEITQVGWGDYWNDLQTSMVGGTAPDVFTNHLAKYPEFASKGQMIDIEPMVKADKIDVKQYLSGLADLWTRDGKRYGLPKDWDTIAIVYNKQILKDAGIDEKELENLTWNPKDGGSFEKLLAKLSLDKNGNNGLSPKFDKKNVVRWGTAIDYPNIGAYGQTQFSHFAVSNGWKFNDGMYATKYYYDDPKLVETIQWMADLSRKKGFMTPYEEVGSFGSANALFTSGKIALILDGSWMIDFYSKNTNFPIGFARLPIGPKGRKSMFNGLADSIWTGTKHPKEAWQWVKYLASKDAQDVVGSYGVVFPAIESGVQAALKAFKARNLDVSAYTAQALEKDGTFLFPITDNASQITSIMQQAFDTIFLGQATAADALKKANVLVNATFKK